MTQTDVLPFASFYVPTFESNAILIMPSAEEKALREHRGVIKSLAKKYARAGRSLEDLEQEASIAFIKAYRSWDETKGQTLSTWAHRLIDHALLDAVKKVETESRFKTDPPPPSGRKDDASHDPADLMDLMKDESPNPEEAFAEAEERRELIRLMATISLEDRQFLFDVKELGIEGYVRRSDGTPAGQRVAADKRKSVERRVRRLEESLRDQKWSA